MKAIRDEGTRRVQVSDDRGWNGLLRATPRA